MSYTKFWERIIEQKLRCETSVYLNQFGFMPKRLILEVIFISRQLMGKYKDRKICT